MVSVSGDGCQCSEAQILAAINENLAQGFNTLLNGGTPGGLGVTVQGQGLAGAPAGGVLTVQGGGYQGTATAVRGLNVTQYSINDVVGGPLTFINAGPNGGDILITSLRMMCNITALPSGMGSFTLHLYNATPPSAIADNSPFTLGSGDRASYIGHIDGLTVALLGTGTSSVQGQLTQIIEQVRLVGGTSLYAYLVTNAAYTPAGFGETYDLKIRSILP